MTKPRPPEEASNTRRVLFCLSLYAPMTRAEIAQTTGLTSDEVKAAIDIQRRRFGTDQIYMIDWRGEEALYALGPGIDAPRPSDVRAGRVKRNYRQRAESDGQPKVIIKPYQGMVGVPAHPFDGLLKGKQS